MAREQQPQADRQQALQPTGASNPSQNPGRTSPSLGPSGLPTDFTPPTLQQLTTYLNMGRTELASRRSLAKGIGPNAKACEAHQVARRTIDESKAKGEEPSFKLRYAAGPQITELTVVKDTALMPLCRDCFVKETDHAHQQPVAKVDGCSCGTKILEADCVYCGLGQVEQKKMATIEARGRMTIERVKVVVCKCGKLVAEDVATVRECAGCDGIVGGPFQNFAGETIGFVPHSTDVVRKAEDGERGQHHRKEVLGIPSSAALSTRITGTLNQAENSPQILENSPGRITTRQLREAKEQLRERYNTSDGMRHEEVTVPFRRLEEIQSGLKHRMKALETGEVEKIWWTCGCGRTDRDVFARLVRQRWGGKVDGRDLVLVVKAATGEALL